MRQLLVIPLLLLFNYIHAQQIDLIKEDFNKGFPTNWTHYYSSWGGEHFAIDSGALREASGPYFVAVSQQIELPPVNLTSVSDPFLEFDLAMAVIDINVQFSVYYTTDSTWNPLLTYSDTSTAISIHTSLDNNWRPLITDYQTISVDLSQFAKDTNIRFSFVYDYQNAWASGVWYIDNVNIFGNSTTGISDLSESTAFQLFPNPTSGQLNFAGNDGVIKSISIIDVNGKIHLPQRMPTKSIDVSALPDGIYFARIVTEGGVMHRKFVKN